MWSTLIQLWGAGLILCQLGQAFRILRSHWDVMLDLKKLFGEDNETSALAGIVVTIVAAALVGYYLLRALATKWVATVITGVIAIVAALWGGNYMLRDLFPLVVALYSELSYETFVTILVTIFVDLVWVAYKEDLRTSKGLRHDEILIIGILVVVYYCLLKGLFALVVAVHLYTGLSSDIVFRLVAAILWALDFAKSDSERYFLSVIAVLVAGNYVNSGLAALLVAIHLQSGYFGICVTIFVLMMLSYYFLNSVNQWNDLVWTKRVFVISATTAALYFLWTIMFVLVMAVHVYSRLSSKILFVAVAVFLTDLPLSSSEGTK